MKKLVLSLLVLPFLAPFAQGQNPVVRLIECPSATGNDTYSCSPIAAITSYDNGQPYWFRADVTNIGTASINFGLGAKTIVKPVGGVTTTLADGDIRAGAWVQVVYNQSTDSMQMVSMLGNASTGGGGTIQSTILGLKGDGAGNAVAMVPGSDYVLPSGNISGNSGTTSALDHDPAGCVTGTVVNDVSAAVALNCITLLASQVTNAFDKSASNTVSAGTQDFSAAAHTLPDKVGTLGAIPATCTVGEQYFSTSATAGQNKYLCTSTNTWTQQSGGGGGGTLSSINSDSTVSQTLTKTNDTNIGLTIVDNGSGDHKFNMGWIGTLSAARLNSAVVQATSNDTNITGSIAAQTLTFAWAGALAKARQHANTVYTDQANTFGAFLQDFSAASLKMPIAAGLTVATNGLFGYDSTNNMIHAAQATADAKIPQFTVSPTNGHCANWVVSGSNYKLGTLGVECLGDPGANGLVSRTALGASVARTLAGTSNVSINNGDGVSGNPTIDVGGFQVTKTSGTVETIGAICAASTPCQMRIGSVVYTLTSAPTVTLSGTSNSSTVFWYLSSALVLTAGHNSTTTLTGSAGVTVTTGITGFPADSIPLWQTTFTSNVWDAVTEAMDKRAIISRVVIAPGAGIASSNDPSTGVQTLTTDSTIVPRYFTGSGAPSSNCTTGRDFYTDSTNLNLYFCDATNTWKQSVGVIASGAKALATSAISSAACSSAQTATATGTLTTDVVTASFNGDPTAVTGYVPLTAGMLTIIVYPTADTVNFKVCNNTSSSITPGAITLNWRVSR